MDSRLQEDAEVLIQKHVGVEETVRLAIFHHAFTPARTSSRLPPELVITFPGASGTLRKASWLPPHRSSSSAASFRSDGACVTGILSPTPMPVSRRATSHLR